jgi:S-adenosylmethionine decarboxylase
MNSMGHHCLLNVYGCDFDILNNEQFLIEILKISAEKCGATVLDCVSHKFEPQGVTAILLLSESHISVHTFPEKGKAAFDIFTCGRADSNLGVQCILQNIECQNHTVTDITR